MMRVERSRCFAVGQFHRPASFPVDHSRARVLDCALGFAGLQESNHLRSPLRWCCGTAALATMTGAGLAPFAGAAVMVREPTLRPVRPVRLDRICKPSKRRRCMQRYLAHRVFPLATITPHQAVIMNCPPVPFTLFCSTPTTHLQMATPPHARPRKTALSELGSDKREAAVGVRYCGRDGHAGIRL